MSEVLAMTEGTGTGGLPINYTREQIELIKRTYAKDASDDELNLFVYAAKRLKLDIMARQIHFTKRQGKPVFIVAIDGYRLNAERTGQYAPGREPSYVYSADGNEIISATAYVKKYICGEWHEIGATAFMAEYRPSDESSAFMWKKMPHNQLAKCAEALALRRAFPNELSDTISESEADQVREPEGKEPIKPAAPKFPEYAPADAISEAQAKRFYAKAKGAGKSDDTIKDYLALTFNVSRTAHIPKARYDEACAWAEKKD